MSSGAERGLVFVDDFRDGNVINSSSDLLDSGSGRILASRNLLLLKEKKRRYFQSVAVQITYDFNKLTLFFMVYALMDHKSDVIKINVQN